MHSEDSQSPFTLACFQQPLLLYVLQVGSLGKSHGHHYEVCLWSDLKRDFLHNFYQTFNTSKCQVLWSCCKWGKVREEYGSKLALRDRQIWGHKLM